METKNNVVTEIKEYKEIKNELVIGGGDCDLYLEALVDGETVVNKKADSLLSGFLQTLYLQMCGRSFNQSMPTTGMLLNNNSYTIDTPINISSISLGNSNMIRISVNYSPCNPGAGTTLISIQGVQSSSSIALTDGLYQAIFVSGETTYDLVGTTFISGDDAKYITNTGSTRFIRTDATARNCSIYSFSGHWIVVGTGTNPVNIADVCLQKEMQTGSTTGRLTYNTGSISQDTSDSTNSQITFTRTFTNNSGSSVTINELGMYAQYGHYGDPSPFWWDILIMRDLATIVVASGKTLTINYKIISTLSAGTNPGGFTQIFTKLLYRHFSQSTRAAIDINNVSQTAQQSPGTFKVTAPGGLTYCNTYEGAGYCLIDSPWKSGIVLGTGSAAVTENDYYLNNAITHGTGAGQLLYYGGFVGNYVTSSGLGIASFDINKVFENASGLDITVNEIAMIVGASSMTADGQNGNELPLWLHMIARNVLTTPVTATNGQMLKVTYTIKVTL